VTAVAAPFTTFRFEVVLDLAAPVAGLSSPLCDAAFAECDGLEMTMEPKTIESGGVNDRQIHLIGPVKYAQLTLKRGMTANLQLWTWFSLNSRGTVTPASGTVTLWDTDATPVIQFLLEKCLPVRMRAPALNARDGLVAVEELSLVYEKLSISTPGSSGLGNTVGITQTLSSQGVGGGVSLSVGLGIS
jgi:phage tail-like protein